MKNRIYTLLILLLMLASCKDLTLNPLSQGSTENWFSQEDEISKSIVSLYNIRYWNSVFTRNTYDLTNVGNMWTDSFSDDWSSRTLLTAVTDGTINGQSGEVVSTWSLAYTCIANANMILTNLDKAKGNVTEEKLKVYEANARFIRASQYAKLIFYFGDVPYYENVLTIDEAFSKARTAKSEVLAQVYEDMDFAIANLPTSYGSGNLNFATKGAALAMKARTALYMGDYALARDAAKSCMDLKVYNLYPDFSKLFLIATRKTVETIFSMPRSKEMGEIISSTRATQKVSRNAGYSAFVYPSWDLFCSFLCADGLPIDESPLFNPKTPFKNRDPRCTATIVEFQTEWLGFTYQPHPDTLKVLNHKTGVYQNNKDNKAVDQFASFNGLLWKKSLDENWISQTVDPDNVVIRYADVLLMYAEAKIELGEIDQSVLDAINEVRARAYGVDKSNISAYPVVTATSQSGLRKTLRIERRMEFAGEGLRYNDLIRWKLAEKALNRPVYGILDPAALRTKVVKPGLWFFPATPAIDEDGIPDFSPMFNAGLIKLLATRKFDASRQYLWPVPTREIFINKNLSQNPGY